MAAGSAPLKPATDTIYPVKVHTAIRVTMRDGVELNVRVTRPDAPGRFPGVMEYHPYRRLGAALPDYRDEYPPVVPYLAERGYAVVQFDVRGTGSSSGYSTDIYSPEERQDGYDMVAWIAAQPWCTGAVGMIGKSYGAVVQWQVAVQRPPALKAIVVRSANDDVYTGFTNPGGCIRPWMFEYYAPLMNALNFAPPDPALVGDRWAAIWAERLEHSAPWSLGYIRNTLHGPYWRDQSLAPDYDRVECAVLLIEGWADWYATEELRAFQRLNTPKKVLIGPWGHYYAEEQQAFPGPRIDARREYLHWFDHWLKDIDNGVMSEPPVTVFVRGWQAPSLLCLEDTGAWRNESTWPPERLHPTTLYLSEGGMLTDTAGNSGSDSYQYRPSVGITTGRRGLGSTTPWAMPIDQRLDEAHSLLFTTEPLRQDLELLGQPEALLHIASTAEVAYFHMKLCDLAPDGASRLICDGGLLATHRNSHETPEKLAPGQVYALRIPLRHCAYAIQTGHRLRIAIASAEFQNAWPTGQHAVNTIFRGGHHASHIVLPVAPRDAHPPAPPEFAASPHALPAADSLAPPGYTFELDLVNDTVTCALRAPEGGRTSHHSRYTVSNHDPAHTTIIGSAKHTAVHPTLDIRIEATCQTTSDADTYSHLSQVRITVDGAPHFSKSWSESVPRKLS
ncbi:MAG TPA: CocE/NonD family hydrolase [Acetobacteraceae bacterium]|nr:CocE/NonD family hydrolase [Acetobacteraceae bacterium]